jgi:hypothetical protein
MSGRDPAGRDPDEDPGAFIGRLPERAEETIPGGVRDDDERIAAHSTQGTGAGRPDVRGQPVDEPSGHREGPGPSDHRETAGPDDTGR